MSDNTPDNAAKPDASPDPATAGAPAGPAKEAPPAAEPEGALELSPEQLVEIIGALQTDLENQKKEQHADHVRHAADMDNLRKRLEREAEERGKFAITKLATALIGVADNFERALAAVPEGAADADPALAGLVEGVGMIERELKGVLEKHGVQRLWPEGEAFNPHQHQAMMQEERPDLTPGTILKVFQAGYIIENRVVRPAVVVVAKGGVKAPKPEAGSANDSSTDQPADPLAGDPSNSE